MRTYEYIVTKEGKLPGFKVSKDRSYDIELWNDELLQCQEPHPEEKADVRKIRTNPMPHEKFKQLKSLAIALTRRKFIKCIGRKRFQ